MRKDHCLIVFPTDGDRDGFLSRHHAGVRELYLVEAVVGDTAALDALTARHYDRIFVNASCEVVPVSVDSVQVFYDAAGLAKALTPAEGDKS